MTTRGKRGEGGRQQGRIAQGPRLALYAALAVTGLLVAMAVFGEKGLLELRGLKRQVAAVEQEIQVLEQKNTELSRQVISLREDPRAIEAIAREELGLVKEGEVVYQILPGEGGEKGDEAPPEEGRH